jgi:hypothetical protein
VTQRLLGARTVSTGELLVAAALLLGLGAAAFGSHVHHGGWYWDDWWNEAAYRYPPVGSGLAGTIDSMVRVTGDQPSVSGRPGTAAYLVLTHAVLGGHMRAHLVATALIAIASSWALYVVLRELRIAPLHAALIAALALLFPLSDVTWLWASGGNNRLAVLVYLLGLAVALRGLAAAGRRSGWLHAGAVVLYVLAVLTYEVVAPIALLSGVLYVGRRPLREVAARWGADLAAVTIAVLLFPVGLVRLFGKGNAHSASGLSDMYDHARTIGDESLSVLAISLRPSGALGRTEAVLIVAGVLVAGFALWSRRTAARGSRDELRRWLLVAAGGAAVVVLGYAAYVPADAYYRPLNPGLGSRVNVLAGFGFVLLVYGVVMVAGTVLSQRLPRGQLVKAALAVVAFVLFARGYLHRINTDKGNWDGAFAREQRVLKTLRTALPRLPSRATVYTFGEHAEYAPGVPIFGAPWDLEGAIQLQRHDGTLRAYPMVAGSDVRCQAGGVHPVGLFGLYGARQGAPYGRAFFVDLRTGTAQPITDSRTCAAARGKYSVTTR